MPPAASDGPPLAESSDYLYAYFFAPFSRVTIVSPSLEVMTIEYAPSLSYANNAVARITFGHQVSARLADNPSIEVSPTFFSITGSLVGSRVDGTWSIVQAQGAYPAGNRPLPAGIQLTVRGKTWDDVMPNLPATSTGVENVELPVFPNSGSEPINGGGKGRFAADLSTPVKKWNWHKQASSWYDVGVVAAQNDLNPEQDPRSYTYHKGVEGHVPAGYTVATDSVWAHLAPYSAARVVAPDGRQMLIRYEPAQDAASCASSSSPGDCAAPAVIEVGLDGAIHWARLAFPPATGLPKGRFVVEGSLVGAPVDGTWTLDSARNTMGLPAGMRLTVSGKTFDNVAADTEPIQGAGSGSFAGGSAPYARTWNWHIQSVVEYHTHATSATDAVETPTNMRFMGFGADSVPAPPPAPRVEVLDTTGGLRYTTAPDGSVTAFIDRDSDLTKDPDEVGVTTPPVGDMAAAPQDTVLRAFPQGTLVSQGWAATSTPGIYEFRALYRGMLPPKSVTVFVEGYYTTTDVVGYPAGFSGPSHHVMLPSDTNPVDGTLYRTTVQLRPGAHTLYYQAVDPLLRVSGTSVETGPTVA